MTRVIATMMLAGILGLLLYVIFTNMSPEIREALWWAVMDTYDMGLETLELADWGLSAWTALERAPLNLEGPSFMDRSMVLQETNVHNSVSTSGFGLIAQVPNSMAGLPRELGLSIMADSGFAGLCRLLDVSHSVSRLAMEVLGCLYTVKINGKTYRHYDKILREFHAIVQDAGKAGKVAKAYAILNKSLEYACLKSFLEVNFGHCIRHGAGELPEFFLHNLSGDTLNDDRLSLLLPYLLDHQIEVGPMWLSFVTSLVERGRDDLLAQIGFQNIRSGMLARLIAAKVPKAVIDRILDSPNGRNFDVADLEYFSLAGYGNWPVSNNPLRALPLCILWSSQKQRLPVPEHGVIVNGTVPWSLPFWMDLFNSDSQDMLKLVQAKGDSSIKLILNLMNRVYAVSHSNDKALDAYQAILTHLRFSKMCTPSVEANFEDMLYSSRFIGVESLKAMLYCRQFKLIAQLAADDRISLSWADNFTLLDRLWQLKRLELVSSFAIGAIHGPGGADFVKSLILRFESPEYISMFTSVLKGPGEKFNHCSFCFCASKFFLRVIFRRPDFIPEYICNGLRKANGYQHGNKQVSRAVHVVHMLMFWEATEKNIAHFITKIPPGELIDFEVFKTILLSKRYTDDFIVGSSNICGPFQDPEIIFIKEFRPDLADKILLKDK